MHKCNLPVSVLDAKDVYPYLKLPDNFMAAVEEEGGVLAASKAVRVLQVWEYDIVPMVSFIILDIWYSAYILISAIVQKVPQIQWKQLESVPLF